MATKGGGSLRLLMTLEERAEPIKQELWHHIDVTLKAKSTVSTAVHLQRG
ncbi:uncharacterized protein V6R79_002389 [Siganus canaliculatus]